MAYAYYRSLTIDHTKCGSADASNFAALFTGTYSWLATVANGGHVQSSSGYDIVFASDSAGSSLLAFERVSYVASSGLVEFWVKIPTVSHTSDTVIYVFYGDATVTTDQSNKTGTWDTNYSAVFHLETGGSFGTVADSTSSSLSTTGNASASSVTAQVGKGYQTTATNQYVGFTGVPSALKFSSGDSITIETWAKRSSNTGYQPLVGITNNVGANNTQFRSVMFAFSGAAFGEPTNAIVFAYRDSTNSSWHTFSHTSADSDTTAFHHYAFTFTYGTGSTAQLYVDGQPVTGSWYSGTGNDAPANNQDILYIDNDGQNLGTIEAFLGIQDELRISKGAARSASWILASYNNQSSPATFYTVGAEIAAGAANVQPCFFVCM